MQHVFLGASVLLMFLWTIRGGLAPGLGVHLLGATVLTLMFGWRLALLAMALALAGTAVYGLVGWTTLGVNGLVGTGPGWPWPRRCWLVGMRPRWIWTFDDGRYLHGK